MASLGSGGTAEQKKAITDQQVMMGQLQKLLMTYTPVQATADASGASNLAMVQAIEKSLPQITAAINASGTSGGGTQAGLAQKSQRDATLAADAASSGLKQTYAGASTSLAGQLAGMANNPVGMQIAPLLANLLLGSKLNYDQSKSSSVGSSGGTVTSAPLTAPGFGAMDPVTALVAASANPTNANAGAPEGSALSQYFKDAAASSLQNPYSSTTNTSSSTGNIRTKNARGDLIDTPY